MILKFTQSSFANGRRPRGTGFLKFKAIDAVVAAIAVANAESGLGIVLKGRQLKVLKALDKKSVHDKELEKTKSESHDHRNLSLAKVSFWFVSIPFSNFGFLLVTNMV